MQNLRKNSNKIIKVSVPYGLKEYRCKKYLKW